MTSTNSDSFEMFSEKHKFWVECLSGKDVHSITNQVYDLAWDMAVWWILINESRRYAKPLENGGVALNGTVHNLIDKCFFQSAMAAIRRLADPGHLGGKEGVIALATLLKDMKDKSCYFTRENILRINNLPYDYESIRNQLNDAFLVKSHRKSGWTPSELNWWASADRHAFIDKLCGVTEAKRTPNDCVSHDLFNDMCCRLFETCRDVKVYVDKFVAHAATPQDRASLNPESIKITFEHIQNAFKMIYKVTNFLLDLFTGAATRHLGSMASHFDYLDRPTIASEKLPMIHKAFDEYLEKINQWSNYRIDEFGKQQ